MNPAALADSLMQYDLLPQSYRTQKRAQQAFYSWATIVGAMAAILIGVSAATVVQLHRREQTNQQIAATAIPLMQLRDEVIGLQESNRKLARWCDAVEAARPDDSMLQSLGAVAFSLREHNESLIESLQLRLPTEYPPGLEAPPDWASPSLRITARKSRDRSVDHWLEHLNRSDRFEGASVEGDEETTQTLVQLIEEPTVQIVATPISTHVLP